VIKSWKRLEVRPVDLY